MAWLGTKKRYYEPLQITSRQMLITAKRLGLGEAQPILNDLITQTPTVITEVRNQLPAVFPQMVAEPIMNGLQDSATQLQRQLS